ncbi:MAG: putative glycoside hydrolase [bacterium]|nr:putative glycoside hydrolase [bacterium]
MFAAFVLTVALLTSGTLAGVFDQPPDLDAPLRAIYLTSGGAASSSFDRYVEIVASTEVNAIVIDLKDPDGRIAFRPVTEPIRAIAPERYTIKDLPRKLDAIHAAGGSAIARVAVFQDNWFAERHPTEALQRPGGALWRDSIGYAWLDAASPVTSQYAVDMAHEAAALGFDEVNFDYIRFPSDGALRSIVFPHWDGETPKTEIVRRFGETIKRDVGGSGIRTSADVFGLSFYAADGMGIGQHLETFAPYFDVLAPMVYPSHYASGFGGHANPADAPYDVINRTLERGMARIAALPEEQRPAVRPWLQDFNLGAVYTDAMVRAQMQAVDDNGGSGWMLWNPVGRFHTGALHREGMRASGTE